MDCRNGLEALKEAELDESEGADMLMVKPALAYLDVVAAMRAATALPLAAYNVSGEYSAVKAAAAAGWLDEARVVRENLMGIRRAGADLIITYHCRDALREKWAVIGDRWRGRPPAGAVDGRGTVLFHTSGASLTARPGRLCVRCRRATSPARDTRP